LLKENDTALTLAEPKFGFLLFPKALTVYPEPDPLVGMDQLEFYGQRAWRPGKLSAEPPDPNKEKLGIQALQYQEKHQVHHEVRPKLRKETVSLFSRW
jgi:hypothetical protein